MLIDTRNIISITEANQNFSKVAKLVDENGSAVILKNNQPKYIVLEFNEIDTDELADFDDVKKLTSSIINRNLAAFKELAKWKKLAKSISYICTPN